MKCLYCGYENKETSKFCENCGAELIREEHNEEVPEVTVNDLPKSEDETISGSYSGNVNDYNNQGDPEAETPVQQDLVPQSEVSAQQESAPQPEVPVQQNVVPQNSYMQQEPPKKKNSKMGIAVMVLGIFGMVSTFFGLIAIGLGVFDFVKNKDKKHLFTVIGLVLAGLGILVSTISSDPSKTNTVTKTESVAESVTDTTAEDFKKELEEKNNELEQVKKELKQVQSEKDALQKEYDEYKEKMKPFEEMTAAQAEAEAAKAAEEKRQLEEAEAQRKAEEEAAKKAEEEAAAAAAAEEEAKGYETGITYDQLARTPDDYVGKKIKFYGRVVQVLEGDGTVNIRLAVDDDYSDIIIGEYSSDIVSSRVLEDDYITIYGTSMGLYSYESTMGQTITIPAALVERIDQ